MFPAVGTWVTTHERPSPQHTGASVRIRHPLGCSDLIKRCPAFWPWRLGAQHSSASESKPSSWTRDEVEKNNQSKNAWGPGLGRGPAALPRGRGRVPSLWKSNADTRGLRGGCMSRNTTEVAEQERQVELSEDPKKPPRARGRDLN